MTQFCYPKARIRWLLLIIALSSLIAGPALSNSSSASPPTHLQDDLGFQYAASIYLAIPSLLKSNLSLIDGTIACLQRPTVDIDIFKLELEGEKAGQWISKKVPCTKVVEILLKRPLDTAFPQMRIALALSKPQYPPDSPNDIFNSDSEIEISNILHRDLQHPNTWKLFGTFYTPANLQPLSESEEAIAKNDFKKHLSVVCKSRKNVFIKTIIAQYKIKSHVFVDCETNPLHLAFIEEDGSHDSRIYGSLVTRDWQRILFSTVQAFHKAKLAEYQEIVQTLPMLLLLEKHETFSRVGDLVNDESSRNGLLKALATLRKSQLQVVLDYNSNDQKQKISARLMHPENLSAEDREEIFRFVAATYSNVNGSLANLAHLKGNFLGQLQLRAAIESIRASEQRVASTLQLGVLAVCLAPAAKLFKGVNVIAQLLKISKNSPVSQLVACSGATAIVGAGLMVHSLLEVRKLLHDASNFAPADRLEQPGQMAKRLDAINPIYLFF